MDLISELNVLPLLTPKPPSRQPRDRRAIERVRVELECEERIGKSRYFRLTTDLSPFGLCTQSGLTHPVGMQMDLRLHLPDDRHTPLRLKAEVVGTLPGLGIRLAFKSPSRAAVVRINRFLRSQEAGPR